MTWPEAFAFVGVAVAAFGALALIVRSVLNSGRDDDA